MMGPKKRPQRFLNSILLLAKREIYKFLYFKIKGIRILHPKSKPFQDSNGPRQRGY